MWLASLKMSSQVIFFTQDRHSLHSKHTTSIDRCKQRTLLLCPLYPSGSHPSLCTMHWRCYAVSKHNIWTCLNLEEANLCILQGTDAVVMQLQIKTLNLFKCRKAYLSILQCTDFVMLQNTTFEYVCKKKNHIVQCTDVVMQFKNTTYEHVLM